MIIKKELVHIYLYFSIFKKLKSCNFMCFCHTALVNSVSVAVEAILAQFSSSRTVVQKVSFVPTFIFKLGIINPTLVSHRNKNL